VIWVLSFSRSSACYDLNEQASGREDLDQQITQDTALPPHPFNKGPIIQISYHCEGHQVSGRRVMMVAPGPPTPDSIGLMMEEHCPVWSG
jgi:hypothetical protein